MLCRGCVSGRAATYDLETAFEERLIGGPGRFVVTADSDTAFTDAVRSKLILEIAGPVAPARPRRTAAAPAADTGAGMMAGAR